jgi:surface protein
MNISDLQKRVLTKIKLPTEFIITVKTDNAGTSASNEILLPIQGTDMVIDWGDGSVSTHTQTATPNNTLIGGNNVVKTYASAGTYQVKIGSTITRIFFNNGGDRLKILDINNWGQAVWTTMIEAFFSCTNLQISAKDSPNLSIVNSMSRMLRASPFNSDISKWDISNVTNMFQLFTFCTNFNKNLSTWNTSNVTNMGQVFFGATSFNQNLSSWNVSNVSDMTAMFSGATSFNQNLGAWELRRLGITLGSLFNNSGMNSANYTDTIVDYANYVFTNSPKQPVSVSMLNQTGRTFDTSRSGGSNFANAGVARTFLTTATTSDGAGWTITNDTLI